jgi:hypothetical protein
MAQDSMWLERTMELLRAALPDGGKGPRGIASKDQVEGDLPDLELRVGGRRVLVEVKTAAASRVSEVLGQFARAVLELQRCRRAQKDILIAVVGLEKFGSKLEAEVRAFFRLNAPDAGWGIEDSRGRAVLEIPALGIRWSRGARAEPEGAESSVRVERQLFTDLNRWMLKILLLRNAPENVWGGPRLVPRHPTDLARIAGVSIEKAHRFVLSFESEGHLRRTPDGLRLVRVRLLLDSWLQQDRGELARTIDVRPLVPSGKSEEPSLPVAAAQWAALGGAMAAKRRGLLHSGGPHVPLVHLRIPVEDALRDGGLEVAEPRDAALRLRRPRHPMSVFRGVVPRGDKLPLVDLWQMALDSNTADSRGAEQAEYIHGRVLELQEGA